MSTTTSQTTMRPGRRSGTQRRQLDAVATARMTPDELARVRAAAVQQGQSVSEYVRGLVLAATA